MAQAEAVPGATSACIAGGGPAGMLLGYLFARAGVDVVVLEKHADFLRDFRGDTVHPSTLQVLRELGLLSEFLAVPHDELHNIVAHVGGESVEVADFHHLRTGCPFIVLMPQWDFLNFLAERARRLPTFHLGMQCAVDDLLRDGNRIVGVRTSTPAGPREIRAGLVIAADGRNSVVRRLAKLEVEDLGAPMDVLWLRVSRQASDPQGPQGTFEPGRIFIMIPRRGYWQCGLVIPKGGIAEVQARGLAAFQGRILGLAPFLGDRVREVAAWDQVSLLTVRVDRLRRWFRSGLLCIGDAAHAMSPIGGVGINLAIQDAVAAFNVLAAPLRHGRRPSRQLLHRVQARREFPTRATQLAQLLIQKRVIAPALADERPRRGRLPWALRLVKAVPALRRLPAYAVGVGFRPEHIAPASMPQAPLMSFPPE